MKLSQGVEWGLHCCTLLALVPPGGTVSAARLAEFHGVPPAYLAKHLQTLAQRGIVAADPGPLGGYRLARPPTEISLLDVVVAVDGAAPAFRCEEIRQRGPAACGPEAYGCRCGVALAMAKAERAWRVELQQTSVADLVADLAENIHPDAATKGVIWLQEVVR